MAQLVRLHPWRSQPPLIGPPGPDGVSIPHEVEYDPVRGHRCLPGCPGYHPDDEDEQLAAPPVTVTGR